MRKNFTRLVCVGIASFCMMAVFGQEKMPVVRNIFDEKSIRKLNEVELRADEGTEFWWPDSLIWYDSSGLPISKKIFNKETKTESGWASWINGNWNFDSEPVSSNGFYFEKTKVKIYAPSGRRGITISTSDGGWHYYYSVDWDYKPSYDTNGNLTVLNINSNEGYFIEYKIKYNEKNNPILIEENNNNYNNAICLFEYNEKGYLVLWEKYLIDSETKMPIIMDSFIKETVKFDDKGRPVENQEFRGSTTLNKWLLDSYRIIYYSDKTNTPSVIVNNNNPIGTNNQGNFDVNVNIPTDSISNGSIIITFPEGFTLDAKNTKLTTDFTALFTLTVTKQENNSWLLEIKPKTLRSASLRADEAKKMLQVAYTVDAKKKKGTYDISVNSILFETKGGNYYPEPAITVPAIVNRWGVGIETVENEGVWTSDGNLYVRTAKACTVSVYTLPGQLIRQQAVGAGETAIPLPQGIYFVKTGGITRKIFVR